MTNKKTLLTINLIAYIAMLIANVLAQSGILNGMTTAEVSDRYTTLFTPSGITFMIWMLIYVLLGIYTFSQLFKDDAGFDKTISLLYLVTCILNILWIFTWHYMNPVISFVLIFMLMVGLMMIVFRLGDVSKLIKATFSIYLAWITVATIASLFTCLVSVFDMKYDSSFYMTLTCIALVCVGVLVVFMGRQRKDLPYILTIIWAVIGILNKHISVSGFNGQYRTIMIGCVLLLFFSFYQAVRIYYVDMV